jgi:2-isopropylmalate synthase
MIFKYWATESLKGETMTVLIQDTTLREGQQTAFVNLNQKQKIELASMLSDFGVNFIDMMPVASPKEMETNKELNNMGLKANVISLCRTMNSDIDVALKADAKWIAVFQGTSQIHREAKLRVGEEESLKKISDAVQYAHDHGVNVKFGLEDASRTSYDYVLKSCQAAKESKVDRVSVADSIGTMRPDKMKELVSSVKRDIGLPVDVHCHNDLGLALANSLAAYEAGASVIHATVNGCGERVGIVRLPELVMALELLYGANLGVKKEMLVDISKKFADFSGIPVPKQMPIVGEYAFKHKSGIHTSALLRNKKTYEFFDPESVGSKRSYVLGDFSGKALIKHLSSSLSLGLDDDGACRELKKLKRKGKDILEFSD